MKRRVEEASRERPRLSARQRFAWLRLIRSENVGPASFRALINRYGSAELALAALPELAARGGAKKLPRIADESEVQRELETAERLGFRFVAIGEPDYPFILSRTELPPPILCLSGSAKVFETSLVGIVGARNASITGTKMARKIAAELGEAGYGTVSGLARGIDAAAHQAALPFGTVAVLAGGLDQPYPQENIPLMEAIVEQCGAIVSEMPLGWRATARDFPRRNRIVAALGLGLVVIEAAKRSGSLISARLAGELGRDVFAVPGSPLDPRSEGSNRLIREGATLVTCAADIVEDLRPQQSVLDSDSSLAADEPEQPAYEPNEDERERIIDVLDFSPVEIDELIRHTGLPASAVLANLLELDLAGRIQRLPGNRVQRLPDE
ncbi:DNA protecting protein DprA [Notoacmeibacter marinus]|uniref:DNA protecting protein DprA n=1 Tax=Notoacmeibacter marinus TaxID=1876515 RepID=A0A231UTH4_9HYPH|nr:DNA-processing protein DprA [Notoacmeibacter marinus]OXS99234.1 DNA protecting protein DprA [Notoacmeibacter marinus]